MIDVVIAGLSIERGVGDGNCNIHCYIIRTLTDLRLDGGLMGHQAMQPIIGRIERVVGQLDAGVTDDDQIQA